MKFISEEQSSALMTHELAFEAAREALVAAAATGSTSFPAVLAHGSAPGDRFSIKAGSTTDLAGLKMGSYWPGNSELGIPRHNSLILLIDQRIGRVEWVIEAGKVNAYRTAAADAVAADVLARPDAATLAIFGAGHQAVYECTALARVRKLSTILIVARNPDKARALVAELDARGLRSEVSDADAACARADIIVTATASRAPLFDAARVRPGTHVSSMGSDGPGKQELPPALFERAALFCDLVQQAVKIGDLQHFTGPAARITAIGDVLSGRVPGRTSADQITVFDSSGLALQDLYIARRLTALVAEP